MEKSKSRSLKVAANLIFVIGLCVCMLGAIAYLVLHELEIEMPFIGAFQWEHLYYVAALLGVIIVIALIFRIAGNVAARKEARADEVEVEINEAPEALEDDKDQAVVEVEADVVEQGDDAEPDNAVAAAVPAKFSIADVLKGKAIPEETKQKIVATVKKNAPVIVAVAATLTVSAMVGKLAKEKRKANIRKNILDLLY